MAGADIMANSGCPIVGRNLVRSITGEVPHSRAGGEGGVPGFRKTMCAQADRRRRPAVTTAVSGFDQAMTNCVSHQACGLVNFQFLHDTVAVRIGGLDADSKYCSGLFRGFTFGNQL